MNLYALSIFLSAFLLFQIQPLISRFILPFFGGTPAVWSTVQLFFQVLLTGGYAYAAWLNQKIPPKRQVWIHTGILAGSILLVASLGMVWPSPVTPDASWKPVRVDTPIRDIFKLLMVSVGLPYFLLSTNSPLMQAWFSRANPGRSPYWLYALSNSGSLLGLLAYPFLIEPLFRINIQGWGWAAGYACFAALAGVAAIHTYKTQKNGPPAAVLIAQTSDKKPSIRLQGMWILLSAVASTMLLASTSQITQEVAATPFLWVLPLSIYLLSFILTYSDDRWYNRKLFGILLIIASAGFVWALADTRAPFIPLIGVYCFLLFVCAMICNGETYRLRPAPAYLTRFYLMTSIGGALGGAAVNLAAPFLFNGYWELPISFGLTWALVFALFISRKSSQPEAKIKFLFNVMVSASILLVGALSWFGLSANKAGGAIFEERNFYGVVRVKEVYAEDPDWAGYNVVHGITIHGLQISAQDKRHLPTGYYSETSGVGLAILNHPKYHNGMKVGVLGLGIGTLAAYGQPGDTYRLYEINPVMVDLAQGKGSYFSFLADSAADIHVVTGDARISLERELPNQFDLLVLDVFSSDSIPVHLVTKESFEIYLQHLASDGILAANISNRHLDLVPVFWQLARHFHLSLLVVTDEGDGKRSSPSQWVLLSRNPSLLTSPALTGQAVPMENYRTNVPLWTDDFNNLFQILK